MARRRLRLLQQRAWHLVVQFAASPPLPLQQQPQFQPKGNHNKRTNTAEMTLHNSLDSTYLFSLLFRKTTVGAFDCSSSCLLLFGLTLRFFVFLLLQKPGLFIFFLLACCCRRSSLFGSGGSILRGG